MAGDKKQDEPIPLIVPVTANAVGLAAGIGVATHYVTNTLAHNLADALNHPDDLMTKALGHLENAGLINATTPNAYPESGKEAAAHRAQIRNALADRDSVLGAAEGRVAVTNEGRQLTKSYSQAAQVKNEFFELLKESRLQREAGHSTEAIEKQLLELDKKWRASNRHMLECEKQFAKLTAKEVPFIEKLKIKNLHFTPSQIFKSGAVFAGASAITGIGSYLLGSRLFSTRKEQEQEPQR